MKTRSVIIACAFAATLASVADACILAFRVPVPGTYHLLLNYHWTIKGWANYMNMTVGDFDQWLTDGTFVQTIYDQGTDSDWNGTNVTPSTYVGSQVLFSSPDTGGARYDVSSCGDFSGETDYDNWLVLWY